MNYLIWINGMPVGPFNETAATKILRVFEFWGFSVSAEEMK